MNQSYTLQLFTCEIKSAILRSVILISYFICMLFFVCSCNTKREKEKSITQIIADSKRFFQNKENIYSAESILATCDSMLKTNISLQQRLETEYIKGEALLKMGMEKEAIDILSQVINNVDDPYNSQAVVLMRTYAMAHLRFGERQNCVTNHSAESCIIPIRGKGIHKDKSGSGKAIEIYTKILSVHPEDYASRWLLNIAYMTIGEYPHEVPVKWLIPGIDKYNSDYAVKPFQDVAPALGLNIRNNAGGTVIEDINNDGYLDIITSDWKLESYMHYFQNDTKGGFIDLSQKSGLARVTGGLNLLHADYDNDGDADILVLRGGWWERFGKVPNSLLRNNGDDTFTDVTIESGLLSKHPTQTAAWSDFNKDGWLDLFIGNETTKPDDPEPCELFLGNGNGTFTEVAAKAGCQVINFIKGVASGDYNNDGLTDLFLSSAFGYRFLLKNTGIKDKIPQFINVTNEAGLNDVNMRCFPTWFWDYNNDGWLDLFVCGYEFGQSIAHTAGTEALNIPNNASSMYLYKNNKDGTFTNVSRQAGLNKAVYAMGSNFGDIDNDGYPDMYLGTGNPEYTALVPNRLFKNMGGESFLDITVPARVGNLQKGHGVAINDIDNDGDQDIFLIAGGAYTGDSYYNSLYLNPGQNDNNWISLRLIGNETNKSAIGSKIKVSFTDKGIQRSVFISVNTGGSFGSSTLRKDIGLGTADKIDEIEITWQKTGKVQTLKNIKPNRFITLKEGERDYIENQVRSLNFNGDSSKVIMCKPSAM